MKIAITGHRYLSDANRVRQKIGELLGKHQSPFTGISSLAIGADQIFADEVLKVGGSLIVVVPMPEYRQTFAADELSEYERVVKYAFASVAI